MGPHDLLRWERVHHQNPISNSSASHSSPVSEGPPQTPWIGSPTCPQLSKPRLNSPRHVNMWGSDTIIIYYAAMKLHHPWYLPPGPPHGAWCSERFFGTFPGPRKKWSSTSSGFSSTCWRLSFHANKGPWFETEWACWNWSPPLALPPWCQGSGSMIKLWPPLTLQRTIHTHSFMVPETCWYRWYIPRILNMLNMELNF